MFWILRRTGAANFFNSINNNYSSKSGASHNQHTDKNGSRPHRKEYGRLSVDDDIANSHSSSSSLGNDTHIDVEHSLNGGHRSTLIDHPPAPLSSALNASAQQHPTMMDSLSQNNNDNAKFAAGASGNCMPKSSSGISSSVSMMSTSSSQMTGFGVNGADAACRLSEAGIDGGDGAHCYQETALSRLQAMAISDDDEYDESLTCNVCDRAFHCHRQLASHQQKKRHFGCSGCDSLFPSLMLLEHHKEEFEHWSDLDDDGFGQPTCCRRIGGGGQRGGGGCCGCGGYGGEYMTDTDSITSDAESEDLERLL